MKNIINKTLSEINHVGFKVTRPDGTKYLQIGSPDKWEFDNCLIEYLYTNLQVSALVERCMAEQREIDAKLCEKEILGYVAALLMGRLIRSQQPNSEEPAP